MEFGIQLGIRSFDVKIERKQAKNDIGGPSCDKR